MPVYGNVEQFRGSDGELHIPNLVSLAIESMLASSVTLKEFFVKKVFSNGGPILNKEISAIGIELFGEKGWRYFDILEEGSATHRTGYTREEVASISLALTRLKDAKVTLLGQPAERLHPYEDAVCVSLGFSFTKHNRKEH